MSRSVTKTRVMVECALMIALATILGYIPLFELPQGGSITLFSTLPIMVVGWRHGLKWGVFTGFVHGLIQMMLGFKNVLYCTTIGSMVLCILLDYILAFMALGLVALFAKPFQNSYPFANLNTACVQKIQNGRTVLFCRIKAFCNLIAVCL